MPMEVLTNIACYLSLPDMWWFSTSVCNFNIFRNLVRCRILFCLKLFFRVERLCLEDSGAIIAGDIVLKIIQGSAWAENNVTIVTSHLNWEFV
jgi:hypothetical protein